ncbi:hypothetical protein D3C73_1205090 [compost metagenome]
MLPDFFQLIFIACQVGGINNKEHFIQRKAVLDPAQLGQQTAVRFGERVIIVGDKTNGIGILHISEGHAGVACMQ